MITKIQELKVTADSHPFTSAVRRCGLEQAGYAEREFLLSGTANIYETNEQGMASVKFADCPYTDRMILRLPVQPERFSGRVVVEIVNSTANFDIDRMWAESYRYLMRNGDIYVGITSKPNVFPALKRFDEARYGCLSWPNPSTQPVPDNDKPPLWTGPKDQETGYIWDILKELPGFLKSRDEKNPLAGLDVRYVYLLGWSQSCGYITRFVSAFETAACHSYDGYFSAGAVRMFAIPLNRYESERNVDSLEKRLNAAPAPVIELNTESEASDEWGCCGYSARRADSDATGFRYRYLDIAGGCHDAVDTCDGYLHFDDDVARAMGGNTPGEKAETIPNNLPKYFAFHMALRNLYLWAEQGIAPKSYPAMAQTAQGVIRKDAFGNSVGGLRLPMIDFPVCTYYNWTDGYDILSGEHSRNILAGHEVPFSPAMLAELYGSLAHYRELVTDDAQLLCADGQLLPEDVPAAIEAAVCRAAAAGLV